MGPRLVGAWEHLRSGAVVRRSLQPEPIRPVPEETARIAHAAFPRGTPWIRLRDERGSLFGDRQFAALFSPRGRSAEAPWRLALVAVMQCAEQRSDRKAADALRGRINGKYALGLSLDDPGFDASVWCEFRARLIAGSAEVLLETLLTLCREWHWLHARGRPRTDSTQVLAAIRGRDWVEMVRATVRHALHVRAQVAPTWLLAHAEPEWAERYRRGWDDERLPSQQAERDALVAQVGAADLILLRAAAAPDAPPELARLPALQILRQVWLQNYLPTEEGVRWRTADDGLLPARQFICSPYDTEAHDAVKRRSSWVGYQLHLTETCEADTPNLITDVVTTLAPIVDWDTTQQGQGLALIGPTQGDHHWPARERAGFGLERFPVDWKHRQASCPAGRTSVSWTPAVDNRRTEVLKIRFSEKGCAVCPNVPQCVHTRKKFARRLILVRRQAAYEALQAARAREKTAEFRQAHACRSGVGGTISQGVRTCRPRRSRYRGLAQTHLEHVLTATALNCLRLSDWLAGVSKAATPCSRFARLLACQMKEDWPAILN